MLLVLLVPGPRSASQTALQSLRKEGAGRPRLNYRNADIWYSVTAFTIYMLHLINIRLRLSTGRATVLLWSEYIQRSQ